MKDTISKAFIALMVPVAGWVGASEPMVWATANAATCSRPTDQARSGLGGSRFDQAQWVRR